MFRPMLLVLAIGFSAVFAESPLVQNPHQSAEDSAFQSLELYLDAIKLDQPEIRRSAIRRNARSMLHAFFFAVFADENEKSMRQHRAFVGDLWNRLSIELLARPGALTPEYAAIFLEELEKELRAIKENELRKKKLVGKSFQYSLATTLSLEASLRAGRFVAKKTSKAWANWRRPDAKIPPVGDNSQRPRNFRDLCLKFFRKLRAKSTWKATGWLALRHGAAAGLYTWPNYSLEWQPVFRGFNNYEPWDFSEDLFEKEVKPFFQAIIAGKKPNAIRSDLRPFRLHSSEAKLKD